MHTSIGVVILVVYTNNIIISGNDQAGIEATKRHLKQYFATKDLGQLRYFLGIEVAQNRQGLVLYQRKYAFDLLQETGMPGARPANVPLDQTVAL